MRTTLLTTLATGRLNQVLLGLAVLLALAAVVLDPFRPLPGWGAFRSLPAALIALLTLRNARHNLISFLGLGFLLGAGGDFTLAYTTSDRFPMEALAFYLGMQLFFFAGLSLRFQLLLRRIWMASLIFVLNGLVLIHYAPKIPENLFMPIAFYATILTATALTAILRQSATPFLAYGLLLVVLAHSLLAYNWFVVDESLQGIRILSLVSYYAALLFISIGGVREVRQLKLEYRSENSTEPLPAED